MHRASNNGIGQFKPIFQVEGNNFRPIFFSHFIADSLLYNLAPKSFHTTKLCSRHYSIEIEFCSEKNKKSVLSHHLGVLGVTYAHQLIAPLGVLLRSCDKVRVSLVFDVISQCWFRRRTAEGTSL